MELIPKATRVANLKKRSAKELGIFKRAVANLAKINMDITKEMRGNEVKIKELQGFNEEMKQARVENETFMKKMGEMLGVKA